MRSHDAHQPMYMRSPKQVICRKPDLVHGCSPTMAPRCRKQGARHMVRQEKGCGHMQQQRVVTRSAANSVGHVLVLCPQVALAICRASGVHRCKIAWCEIRRYTCNSSGSSQGVTTHTRSSSEVPRSRESELRTPGTLLPEATARCL